MQALHSLGGSVGSQAAYFFHQNENLDSAWDEEEEGCRFEFFMCGLT